MYKLAGSIPAIPSFKKSRQQVWRRSFSAPGERMPISVHYWVWLCIRHLQTAKNSVEMESGKLPPRAVNGSDK